MASKGKSAALFVLGCFGEFLLFTTILIGIPASMGWLFSFLARHLGIPFPRWLTLVVCMGSVVVNWVACAVLPKYNPLCFLELFVDFLLLTPQYILLPSGLGWLMSILVRHLIGPFPAWLTVVMCLACIALNLFRGWLSARCRHGENDSPS